MLNRLIVKHFYVTAMAISLLAASMGLHAQAATAKAAPESIPALLVKANDAYAAKDYAGFRTAMERVHLLRPNNSDYMYQLVIARALMNDKQGAYDQMLKMQQSGLSYDFSKTEDTSNIRGTEVFDYVNDLMVMAAQPMGESYPVFTLDAEVLLPETIVRDESRQAFLVGTITEGKILSVDKNGQVSELLKADAENGMWAIFDILVDQERNRLWVSSAASELFAGYDAIDKGRSALFEFNLETLELIKRYPVPVDGRPHSLGSMVMGPNGDIYIADRALPIIYSKPANEPRLKAIIASRDMVSLRGIAIQPDGRMMYVADREMGILVIDFEAGQAGKLAVPDTLNLGGIDGIYLWDKHLIIIQNGIQPQRVMRLELDASLSNVTAVRPLAIAQPEFDYPSYGTVVGEDIFYFANSQWSNDKGEVKPVAVLRTPLNSSKDLEQPDMTDYLKQRGDQIEKQKQEAEDNSAEADIENQGETPRL